MRPGGGNGTQAGVFALLGLLLGGLVLLGVAIWLSRRSRQRRDLGVWGIVAGAGGLGVAFLVLFGAGMRRYGGTVDLGHGRRGAACARWWQEIGTGRPALVGDLSTSCGHDAVAAIGPAVLLAVLVGLVVAVAILAVFALRARGLRRVRR